MRTLLLFLVFASSWAVAGWRSLGTLTGTPTDVVVVDAGVVVASSSGAGGVSMWSAPLDGGAVTPLASLTGSYVGAGALSNGCLVGLDSAANVAYSPGTCGTAGAIGGSQGQHLRIVRGTWPAALTFPSAGFSILRVGSTSAVPWTAAGAQFSAPTPPSMQHMSMGGIDYLAISRFPTGYLLSVDGGAPLTVTGTGVRDPVPFDLAGTPALLSVTTANTLLLHADIRLATETAPVVPVGTLFVNAGMAAGTGIATTTTGLVLSPLPDPAQPVQNWRVRINAPPSMTGRAHCLDARWCAAIDSTNQVWLYENAAAPSLVVFPASADAGSTIRLSADAGDPDGDPLFLSWNGVAVTPVVGAEDGFVVDFTVPANAACGPIPIDVTARDGLHSVNVLSTIQIVGHGSFVTIPPTTVPTVGGPASTYGALITGGCDTATISWQSSDNQSGTGSQFVWRPPRNQCTPANITITATATWSQGAPPTSTSVENVALTPWGQSEVPAFTTPVSQLGATTQIYSPTDLQHVCTSTPGFPGTELLWDPIATSQSTVTPLDGGLLVAASRCFSEQIVASARRRVIGTTNVSDAGTLTVNVQASPGLPEVPAFTTPVSQLGGTTQLYSPTDLQHVCALAPGFPGTELVWDPIAPSQSTVTALDGGLLVVASQCVSEQIVASARRRVIGTANESDAGTITVHVQANIPPLDATVAFVMTADAGPGLVTGTLSLSAACLPQRATSAVVRVLDGTTVVNTGSFAANGDFTLTVPGGCSGGARQVEARLFEDGGDTQALQQTTVYLNDVPVAVGAQSVSRLTARCGEGVHSIVSIAPADGTCMATEASWKVLSGPDLIVTEGRGTSFELQTVASDFSPAGAQFVIEWGVDGGSTKQMTDRRTIDVSVDPFVELSVSSSPALRREESAMEFDLTLHNTTACTVDGLSLSIPLGGATPMLDSVLFDGAKASARIEGTTLVLDGVRLAGDGTSHVRLAARARMLASPSADPTASLNGFVVSMRAPEIAPTASGCGCSTTPPDFWFAAAGLLVLARRRRRAE